MRVPLIAGFALLGAVAAVAAVAPRLAAGADERDPYLWLEEFASPKVLEWIAAENAKTIGVLEKDAHYGDLYRDALNIAEATDRIPAPAFLGGAVLNFWQDAQHVRGIWRRTTVAGYADASPPWHTVLDFDALAAGDKANWVWKGAECAEPAERRCMLNLSDGGEDAVTVREFDVTRGRFVAGGFLLPHGKQRFAWQDDDSLLVAREWEPGQLTTSGYPFVVKRLKRGQPLAAAVEVFRGSREDGGYGVSPMALHDGAGHRMQLIIRPRSTFEFDYQLVTAAGVRPLALPKKSQVHALVANQLIVSLAEDWTVAPGATIAQGALVAIDASAATADPTHLRPVTVYAPGSRESFQACAATRDALLVTTVDNVRGRADVYRPVAGHRWERQPLALPENVAVDIADADLHGATAFLTVTGFLQPSSIVRADMKGGSVAIVKQLPAKFDASHATVEQLEARATDGTRVHTSSSIPPR